ncbi:MAG: sulfurtransferase-like selenium metabolism protein YedF [Candidatus Cloacimonetes bacterium]|nr:sulfurtransferase-like selenium metabolism protein YedF [Candidatus Cloacimonadota bacterium]
MKKLFDARRMGYAQSLIETKKVLEAEDFTVLEIIVDNAGARDNITSFVKNYGYLVESIEKTGRDFHITVLADEIHGKHQQEKEQGNMNQVLPASGTGGKTIVISRNVLGGGNDELGRLLIKSFLRSLAEEGNLPSRIVLTNSAVRLCLASSESLESLAALLEKKVEILVCSTSLDYFDLKDKLQLGIPLNMNDLASIIIKSEQVVII